MPNRLSRETSPYLRQHADNPVDWLPWGPEALALARERDVPILLSIGYAACHWCHVMAHESFEDPRTAAVMNERFVSVKVDREERPDLDAIYMQAVQAMTGQGGWPMTVFLTPAGEPFYGGTYFPPDDRHGLPGFRRVLVSVSDAWQTRRDEIGNAVATIAEMYAAAGAIARAGAPATAATLDAALTDILRRFEPMAGGFGGAPKFPHAMTLDFALRQWGRSGDERALHVAEHSFVQMARGGIYDQLGGGFHRYAVDARWQVPHFEKMLYDNALLIELGTHLWQATGNEEIRRATDETARWVIREMTDPDGGWYSSLDADSEGKEGEFYVWSAAELHELLGAEAPTVMSYFDATPAGNFEGKNILHRRQGGAEPDVIARSKRLLYDVRAKRVWPARDEKILASWNGLMLRAMAESARVFGDDAFRAAALANGAFLARELVRDGRVFRVRMGGETRVMGFLEDHAAIALGFVALYELTFDLTWLDRARELATACVAHFWDNATNTFYDTAADHETLVTRPRDIMDNATPAGISLAVELLLVMAELTGDDDARRRASAVVDSLAEAMSRYATMFGHLLGAADLAVRGGVQVALAGTPGSKDFAALADAVASVYVPALVVAGGIAGDALALMEGRAPVDGRATAYICRGYVCEAPIADPDAVRARLAIRSPARG